MLAVLHGTGKLPVAVTPQKILGPCKHEMHQSGNKYMRKSKNMQEIHQYTP